MINISPNGLVRVDYGPLEMDIQIESSEGVDSLLSQEVAKYLIGEFKEIMNYIEDFKELGHFKETSPAYPRVLNRMIEATNRGQDPNLNVLAAVAGAFSDEGLELARLKGGHRIILNNGGDIALYDRDRPFKVALPFSKYGQYQDKYIDIGPEDEIGGICTSGISGRGLSKGIADFVVVFSKNAAYADALATHLCNQTYVDDENILSAMAEDIDSNTDIRGQRITLKVGNISKKTQYLGLLRGLTRAEDLYKTGHIKGAIFGIKGVISMYPEDMEIRLKEL